MENKARIHPRSFVNTPREHINVPPEKLYQLFLLLRSQLSSDLKKNFSKSSSTTIFSRSSHFTSSAGPLTITPESLIAMNPPQQRLRTQPQADAKLQPPGTA